MIKRARKASGAMVALTLVGALAGCGTNGSSGHNASAASNQASVSNNKPSGGGAQKPVTVTFWYGIGGQLSKQIQQFVKKFNDTHPGIKVVATYQGSYSGGGAEQQKLVAAIQAGQPPDIAQIEVHSMALFASSGRLANITSLMRKSKSDKPGDFLRGMLASTKFNNKYYGIPFNRSVPVLFYNTQAFRKAGISSPPTTWAELMTDAKKLTHGSGSNKVYGFEPLVDWWPWEYTVWSSGGNILSSNGKSAAFDKPNALGILKDEFKLVQSGEATVETGPNYWNLMISDFAHGRVAMDIDSIGSAGEIASEIHNKFQWKTAVLPTYQGNTLAVPPGGGDVAIMSGISQRKEIAAWTFLQWWTQAQRSAQWSEMTGYLPSEAASIHLSTYQSFLKKNPQYQVALSELKYQKSPPLSSNYLTVLQQVQQGLQAIFDEKHPVQSTMTQTAKRVDSNLR